MQRHARHVGLISGISTRHRLRTALRDAGYVGAAALARAGEDIAPGSWVGMKRTMCPTCGLALPWARMAPTASALRRRNAGIVGRLRRQAQLRLKFGDPRDERLDPRDQCGDQGVFLGQIRRRCHPKVDSYSRCRRNQKNTVPNTGPSSHPQTGREQLRVCR